AVIVHNGVGDLLANYLLGVMDFVPGDTMENYASIIGISTLLSLLMTMPGAPAVLVPIAQELSTATGMSLLAVIMTQMAGLTIMLLPYQGPPIVVAMSMAGLRLREVFAALMFMAAVMIFILTPLNYLWWRMLGLI
ncbi:MAG: SLC13 family permease, partial [Rhodospirillales bacterium]|nr:SLC13 family permease [Rhodospirillales bacterium]